MERSKDDCMPQLIIHPSHKQAYKKLAQKLKFVERENRNSLPNGDHGVIAMIDLSSSLNESMETPYTDAWGYEFSSTRVLLTNQHPKRPRKCPAILIKCLKRFRLRTVIFTLFVTCCIIALSYIYWSSSSMESFDGSLGPQGGKPSIFPMTGLPVRLNDLKNHSTYFGVDLNWTVDDPQYINQILNISNSIFGVKVNIQSLPDDVLNLSGVVNSSGNLEFLSPIGILHTVPNVLEWQANLIRGTGAIMAIDLLPSGNVSNTLLDRFVDQFVKLNNMNLSLLVRFAPDMNGNWWPYGQKPDIFISNFRYLSLRIRNKTNDTAMVWSPAPGNGYPFDIYNGRVNNKSALPILDTNRDGKFSSLDDPYSPYYPGDDFVDWIGFSPLFRGEIYPKSNFNSSIRVDNSSNSSNTQSNNTNNILPPKEMIDSDNPFGISFEQQLTGGKVNIYDTYVYGKKKPLILWDIGAAFYSDYSGESEYLIKSSWLSQIINPFVLKKYSLIKAVILSDLYFVDPLCNNKLADYSFTNNPSLLESIKNQVYKLKSNSTLAFAPDNSSLSLLHANISSSIE